MRAYSGTMGQKRAYELASMEQPPKESTDRRLNSWKEIASFFGRDERTVRRWEKDLALPVHRIPGGAKGRIFAFESELRQWLLTSEEARLAARAQESQASGNTNEAKRLDLLLHRKWVAILGICALLVAAFAAFRIAHRFRVQASGDSRTASERGSTSASRSSQAEDLYLAGRYYWNKRNPDDLNRAVDYFTQAIVRDPNYARPYVGLADCYNLLREFSAMPADEAYPRALAAATKAVELDNSSAEAHTSLAFVTFYWNWDAPAAEREFQQALAIDPNDARAHHWYATFLMASGRLPEALDQIEMARRLDPSSVAILADKGIIMSHAGHTDDALLLLKQIENEEPSFVSSHRYLCEIYFDRKDYPNFLSEWEKTAQLTRNQQELAIVKAAQKGYSKSGYKGMLEATLDAQDSFYVQGTLPAYSLALTYARLERTQDSLRYLETALRKRESALLALGNEEAFDYLHADPQYIDLMKRVHSSPKPNPLPLESAVHRR